MSEQLQQPMKKPETAQECLDFLESASLNICLPPNATVMDNYNFFVEVKRCKSIIFNEFKVEPAKEPVKEPSKEK